jgi:hypothetical protein
VIVPGDQILKSHSFTNGFFVIFKLVIANDRVRSHCLLLYIFLQPSLRGTKQSPTIQSGDAWRFTYLVKPLIAAEAISFVLIQKKQKIKSLEMLLCRTVAYPANQAKPGLRTFAPLAPHS